jgi:hypothetical protein
MNKSHAPVTLIDGKRMYDVRTFAVLTGRTIANIKYLCNHGNKVRKMLHRIEPNNRYYIDAEELHEFPFVTSGAGRFSKVYYYNQLLELENLAIWDSQKGDLIRWEENNG